MPNVTIEAMYGTVKRPTPIFSALETMRNEARQAFAAATTHLSPSRAGRTLFGRRPLAAQARRDRMKRRLNSVDPAT